MNNLNEIAVVLISESSKVDFLKLANDLKLKRFEFVIATTLSELQNIFLHHKNIRLLLSYGTSVIVPKEILESPGLIAINIHAASPDYPGRDPHHFAMYENAKVYGATLHFMTEKVDEGEIIDVELFPVEKDCTLTKLLDGARQCSRKLLERVLIWLDQNKALPISDYGWGQVKRTRSDFLRMCHIDDSVCKEELNTRIKAFYVEGYQNLYTEIDGVKYYYDAHGCLKK